MKRLVYLISGIALVTSLVIASACGPSTGVSGSGQYDIAINNGRLMDPLSGFDGVANIGIQEGKIATIVPASQKLAGKRTIDAKGLVVAPGFIDIHGHDTGNGTGAEFHVRDGITTEVTSNCGISGTFFPVPRPRQFPHYPIADFFSAVEKEGLIINVASYIGNITMREAVGVKDVNAQSTPEEIAKMVELVKQEMEAGALGISFGPFYGPGTTYEEMLILAKEVSKLGGGASIHVRKAFPAPQDIEAVEEAINLSKEANVPLLISHRGGSLLLPKSTGLALELISSARNAGIKVATDAQPYDAGYTLISAAVFNAPLEPVAKYLGVTLSDFQVASTVVVDGKVLIKAGEAFSSFEQFYLIRDKARASEIRDPGVIMTHLYKPDQIWIYYTAPFTMVENDGAIYVDQATNKYAGHPRGAGSFAKFLGYWVRERGVCDLMTGISKCSTMAAVWLGLDIKGRVHVGCDADLTLFDPYGITARSTYVEPGQASEGIPYVIVNGALAVDKGQLTGVKAGKVIRRTWKVPGILPNLGTVPSNELSTLTK